jgi:hypothetical protein
MSDLSDPPLFRSVEAALAFAYRHPLNGIARPAINRMADGPTRTGRGLVGLDGAGQAGLILSAVSSLGEFSSALCDARYLPHVVDCTCGSACCTGHRVNQDWRLAVDTVTEGTNSAIPNRRIMLRLRQAVVFRYFGEKARFVEIAKACRVDRDTASAHANAVTTFLRGQERQLRADLCERLGLGIAVE